MSEIVERLRALADERSEHWPNEAELVREAADALERAELQIVGLKLDMPIPDKLMGQLIGCNTDLNSNMLALSDERDALKAKLAEAEQRVASLKAANDSFIFIRDERDEAEEKEAKAWGAVAEARAEAAALREAATKIRSHGEGCIVFDNPIGCSCGLDSLRAALSQPGPGAAMLLRVKKLEAVAEAARAVEQRMGMGELDDLAKALAALDADAKEQP